MSIMTIHTVDTVMPTVVMMNVVMLSVVAPSFLLCTSPTRWATLSGTTELRPML